MLSRDLALTELVYAVNLGGSRVAVSFLVGGALITGQLASAIDFASAYNLEVVNAAPDLDGTQIAHLADATVNGQAQGWWRVQIDRVDAFSLQTSGG